MISHFEIPAPPKSYSLKILVRFYSKNNSFQSGI
jgi:hypothetical protein